MGIFSGSCDESVDFILKSAKRSATNLGDTLYTKLIEKYLENDTTVIRTLGRHFLKLIENNLKTGALPTKDVYREMVSVLKDELIYNDLMARDTALEVLAVFASRGAEWFYDGITNLEEVGKFSSLSSIMIITAAIQYFDKVTFHKKKWQFSMPKEITTTCYYAKPYHFWMAAYMGYDSEVNGGFGKKVSVTAAHLIGVGYEFARLMNEGYNYIPIDKKNLTSKGANAVRVDITFNTLGAWFGVSGSDYELDTPKIDGDKALTAVLNSSNFRYAVLHSTDNLFGIEWFKEVDFFAYYSPNAHIDYVLEEVYPTMWY